MYIDVITLHFLEVGFNDTHWTNNTPSKHSLVSIGTLLFAWYDLDFKYFHFSSFFGDSMCLLLGDSAMFSKILHATQRCFLHSEFWLILRLLFHQSSISWLRFSWSKVPWLQLLKHWKSFHFPTGIFSFTVTGTTHILTIPVFWLMEALLKSSISVNLLDKWASSFFSLSFLLVHCFAFCSDNHEEQLDDSS